jgi:hypothetical protein
MCSEPKKSSSSNFIKKTSRVLLEENARNQEANQEKLPKVKNILGCK